jgi:UDP-glucuronate 4-epimerase
MAPWLFTQAILEGKVIKVFNHGKMLRDFTYIDDIVDGTLRVLDKTHAGQQKSKLTAMGFNGVDAPYSIYNVGNNNPTELLTFIQML